MKNSTTMRRYLKRAILLLFPLILILYVLLVLYPNPLNLVVSIQRTFNPEVDPVSVEPLLKELPSDPEAIEEAIRQQIPYSYDWEVHNMPWYFPSAEEALEKGKGDCKARALVFASVLEAKNIPYSISVSPIHVWVEYEEKKETTLENNEVTFYRQDPETGEKSFKLPEIPPDEVIGSFWEGFWNPMPGITKALLVVGIPALIKLRFVLARRAKSKFPDIAALGC